MLKVSLLTIGDEILIGQTVNTNASWIASHVTTMGCAVVLNSVVGDEKSIIISEISRLIGASDIVIITGGLGPTHDDITKSTLSEYFKDELVFNPAVYERLKEMFQHRGYLMTERNEGQAWLPSKCKIFD
ncbi:MAG: competence/damage-inducible protein A, partial [Pseudomonadota bacterium]